MEIGYNTGKWGYSDFVTYAVTFYPANAKSGKSHKYEYKRTENAVKRAEKYLNGAENGASCTIWKVENATDRLGYVNFSSTGIWKEYHKTGGAIVEMGR